MEIIDRKTALDLGLTRYFTGEPCLRGHIVEWYVSGPGCLECATLSRKGLLEPLKIYGVGFNSGKRGQGFPAKTKEGILREYDHWRRMLQRSYDTKWQALHPTYAKCEVGTSWWDYQGFARDFHNCKYRAENSDLDKDLIVIGNKTYSKEFCVYLPEEINKTIIIEGTVARWHSRDEIFEYNCNGVYLGRSSCHIKLGELWVDAKLGRIRYLADKYKDVIDPAAHKTLMEFQINFDSDGRVFRVK
jgi:hypothetical protein